MCLQQHDAGLLISASNNLQLGVTTGSDDRVCFDIDWGLL